MNNNSHEHITHDEIERYAGIKDEYSTDSKSFFQEFEGRLNNCPICEKRFQAYLLLSSLTDEESIDFETSKTFDSADSKLEAIVEVGIVHYVPAASDVFVSNFLEHLKRIGEIVFGNLTLVPRLAMAGTRNADASFDEKRVISINQGENGDYMHRITVKENVGFFEFEIFQSTPVLFTMSIKDADSGSYKLVLCHEHDDTKYSYPMLFKEYEVGVLVENLTVGKFIGAIIRCE